MFLISVLILCLIIIVSSLRIKSANIFSPWLITALVWLSILILYLLKGYLLNPLSEKFFFALFLWVGSLSFSSIISYLLTSSGTTIVGNIYRNQVYNRNIFKLFLLISFAITPVYFYTIFSSLGGDYTSLFLRLRDKAVTGGYQLGIVGYVETLNFVMLVISMYLYPIISKKIVLYFLLVNIFTGFAIMEKGTFFEIFIMIIFILYLKKKIRLKTIIYAALFFILLMIGFQFMRSGGDGIDIVGFLTLYILSPSAAFDTLSPSHIYDFGANTFSFYYKLSNALFGTSFTEIPMLKDFVYVPMGVNVYTVMQPYFEDFGYSGVLIFGIINGVISGFVYKKSMSGGLNWICLYTFICEYYVLQFFQERLFISHSDFIQIIILTSLLIMPNFRFSKIKTNKLS